MGDNRYYFEKEKFRDQDIKLWTTMMTQWEQREELTDSYLRINALFSVTVAATGIARVTHNWEEGSTSLPKSLSLHWPSYVTFNWSVWHNSTESPRMKRAFRIFPRSHWFEGERGTDRVTVMERYKNSALMHQNFGRFESQKFEPGQDYPGLDHKVYLSRRDENSQGAITSEADTWKSQCCDPSNSLPGLIYSWAACYQQADVKSPFTQNTTITNEFDRVHKK